MIQNNSEPDNEMALGKFLSTCGVASRRHAVDLVKAGKIIVNDEVELNPARRITDLDTVLFQGKKVAQPTKRHYIMLHKPRGYVCTAEDPHAKKKALDLIQHPDRPRLFSAGRLDKDSEGMLIFSDDGDLVNRMTHPSGGIRKIYEVSTDYELTPRDIDKLTRGITDEGERLRALSIRYLYGNKYEFILGEGKNREIRRLLASVRNRALRLKRVAVGSLSLGALPSGKWRELTKKEIELIFMSPKERIGSID